MLGAFRKIFQELNFAKVEYIVVGGVAVVLQGVNRATADLDLIIELVPANTQKIISVIENLGYKPVLPVKAEEFTDDKKRENWVKNRNMTVFSFWDPAGELPNMDIFVENPIDYERLSKSGEPVDLGGVYCTIASIEHLIELKRIAAREKDLADIAKLEGLVNDKG